MSIEFSYRKSLELDFHEIDKGQSGEIPLELKYHIGNILSLIRRTIEKLKISLILPKILENPKVLQQYLKNTEYHSCLKLVQEYKRNESKSEPHLQESHDYQSEYQLIQLIDYFQENYKILDVLPNWLDDIDKEEKRLLAAFEDVYQIAEERFQKSAIEVLGKEKHLHEVYTANEEVKRDINETIQRLETKKLNRLWKLTAKTGVIKNLEDDISFYHHDNKAFVKKEMSKSLHQIQHNQKEFKAKKQVLEEDLKQAHLTYEKELETNLKNEKNIRDERNKIQLQLQALIKKYDQTMYKKYSEEILLQREYENEKQECDKLNAELVRKREQKLKSFHADKIRLFTYNRAAKKIQRWWKTLQRRTVKTAGERSGNTKKKKNQTVKDDNKKNQNKTGSKGKKIK